MFISAPILFLVLCAFVAPELGILFAIVMLLSAFWQIALAIVSIIIVGCLAWGILSIPFYVAKAMYMETKNIFSKVTTKH